MGGNFLAKWWTTGSSMNAPAVQEAQAELEQLLAQRPSLTEPAEWLARVLPDLATRSQIVLPELSRERAIEKLAAGIPLLRGEQLQFPARALRKRWQRGCAAVPPFPQNEHALLLAEVVRQGRLDLRQCGEAVLMGNPGWVFERAVELGADPAMTGTLVRFAFFPELASLHAQLTSHLSGAEWRHGYCPVCGAWPRLSELRGLDQRRYLRCSACVAAWKVPRLWCPFCGNRDHERLGLFHREGEENRYRVASCLECRRYLKQLLVLDQLPPLRLWVAEVAMLHLDLAAAERGLLA